MNSRRNFLKTLSAGLAGSFILPTITESLERYEKIKPKSSPNSEAFWEDISSQFRFEDKIKYFNNGSLGSCPEYVRTETNKFRDLLDSFPSKYMWGGWKEEKEATRKKVADLFSVDKEEIALIHNTTEGMNLIARSFDLQAGDEVILANHEHPSGRICWEVFQETKGIKLVKPELPILPETTDDLVDVYRKAITSKTKVISLCHVVNTNGMMLPVKEISKMAHEKGIFVAVDGAQSAAMFEIDLHDLGCDFYATSSHKWLFTPKGMGILYAKKESQNQLKPLVVANGHTDKSIRRLENYNTRNLPEYLGVGAAVDYHNKIGSDVIHKRSFELKHYFRSKLIDNPKFKFKTPEADDLSAAIQVVEVVGKRVRDVKKRLIDEFKIDTRPMGTYSLNALRISLAIYITKKDIDYLVECLETIADE